MTAPADQLIADIWLIRHAPSVDGGAMAGRRDVAADCADIARLLGVRERVGLAASDTLIASPALRCQQTSAALFARAPALNPRLWEQDFGDWEGLPYADLPDLGPLAQPDLAAYSPPKGESFNDLAARVWPVLQGLRAGRHIIVAHAGVIRAGLGLTLGAAHLGLGFSIAPLSLTRMSCDVATGTWAVHFVNWSAV